MYAKTSRAGLRFFAHAPGTPTCALALESVAHHLLKLELANAARDAGAHAELEVRRPDGRWRADVLATDPLTEHRLPRRTVRGLLDRGRHARPRRHPPRTARPRDRLRQARLLHRPAPAGQRSAGHRLRHRPRPPHSGPVPGLHRRPRPRDRPDRRQPGALRDRRDSLRGEDFSHLRNGAYVATVTSSEDELDLAELPDVYTRTIVGDHVTRYRTTGHCFYLANDGNAVNFIHGASAGPFIFLIQAEILAAIRMLTREDLAPGIHEVPAPDREAIAATWLSYFNR